MSSRKEPEDILQQALKLPLTYQGTVPAEYMDGNGHMNVMYYTAVGNMAMGSFLAGTGLRDEVFKAGLRGMFALQQILSYQSELREGDEFAVHSGLVNYDAKRIHFFHYIISLTHGRISCTDERMAMYIDLTQRRSTTFEPEIIERLAQVKAEILLLDWQPELSGAIHLKN